MRSNAIETVEKLDMLCNGFADNEDVLAWYPDETILAAIKPVIYDMADAFADMYEMPDCVADLRATGEEALLEITHQIHRNPWFKNNDRAARVEMCNAVRYAMFTYCDNEQSDSTLERVIFDDALNHDYNQIMFEVLGKVLSESSRKVLICSCNEGTSVKKVCETLDISLEEYIHAKELIRSRLRYFNWMFTEFSGMCDTL